MYSSFSTVYRGLLGMLNTPGEYYTEVNERTQTAVRVLHGGQSFKVDLSENRLPVPGNRRYYPHIAAAEVAWQLMGTKDPSFILSKAPRLWEKFVEDGELKTAYGWRWRHAFGRDQLGRAINELEANPTSRQIWVQAWDPRSDGLGGPQPKNIPCPLGFALNRTGLELHMSLFIRSSDVFVGLPYDVMVYALTLRAIAEEIGCLASTLHVTLAHAHLYKPHWSLVEEGHWIDDHEPDMPRWNTKEIVLDPNNYVEAVKALMSNSGTLHEHAVSPELIE